ncbi:MAG: aldose 1-epimerase family protein [Balneolaceae bacterium]
MTHTIKSDYLQVSIKQKGMELCSIKNLETNKEYLWQGDSQFWTGQAPNLFPIIGLLKDHRTKIDGVEYAIPKHGIVRHSEKAVVLNHDSNSITFQLKWDHQTLKVYPFRFVLELTFRIDGNRLDLHHLVKNEGDISMGFHLGGHPAFNCPVSDEVKYSDYSIEFEHLENSVSWLLNDDGLITDQSKPIFDNSSVLRLNEHLFDEDALIFRDLKSRIATLKSAHSGSILRVEYSDFPYLGIWAKPKAPYVCIEPWIGIADHVNSNGDFMTKEALQLLEPKSEKEFQYSITILV